MSVPALLAKLQHPALAEIELSLGRVTELLAALGNPEKHFPPVIHVAGTNGKGSLIANLQCIFETAGLKVHRYTSPHLVKFNERIVVAGEEISDAKLQPILERVARAVDNYPATFFEATTAAAFLAFAETPADIVLLEVGLGGRLDATNVIEKPLLTAITPVSFDHIEYLGDTLTKIVHEKAGIIKQGVPCVVGKQSPEALAEIARVAKEKQAPLFVYEKDWQIGDVQPALIGEHQKHNAAMAIACIKQLSQLGITDAQIKTGLQNTKWPARLQHIIQGKLVDLLPEGAELWLDGGHNADAGKVLAEWAATSQKLHVICGMMNTKDIEGFLKPLAPYIEELYATNIAEEKNAAAAAAIHEVAMKLGIKAQIANDFTDALKQAPKGAHILICGSLYLAGNVLKFNDK